MLSGLEKKLSGVQQDFTQAIHKISEKENEKFDLIFAILSELQQRQAHLEESVRTLKAQYGGNGYMVPNGTGSGSSMSQPQQQQFGSSSGAGQYSQMNGQMGGQMTGNMDNQQPMQQFTGVCPDGTQAMFTAMPQQMIIMSPPANGAMQYAAVPQMMTPTGAVVQQMPAPMAMQFVTQGASQDMFMNGQQGDSQASGSSVQAQMNQIGNEKQWQAEATIQAGGQAQQDATEVPSQPSTRSGAGSSDTSSQEGKGDDGSPER
jgi:hypothetical protein